MASISSANASFLLAVGTLFPTPQPLQGFDVDDAFTSEPIEVAEVKIGVDGILSYGWIYAIAPTEIMLQADSPSISLFEAWYAGELAAQDKFTATAIIRQQSVGRSYALTNGVLRTYSTFSSARKVLQPRRFTIDWQSIVGAPI